MKKNIAGIFRTPTQRAIPGNSHAGYRCCPCRHTVAVELVYSCVHSTLTCSIVWRHIPSSLFRVVVVLILVLRLFQHLFNSRTIYYHAKTCSTMSPQCNNNFSQAWLYHAVASNPTLTALSIYKSKKNIITRQHEKSYLKVESES